MQDANVRISVWKQHLCTACSGGTESSGDNGGSISDSEHAYEEYQIAVLPKMTGKCGYGYAADRLYILGINKELSLVLMSSADGITWEDASSAYDSAIQKALGEGEALFGAAISEKEALAWVANKVEDNTGSINTVHVTDKTGTDTVVATLNQTIKKLLFSKDGETLYVCTKEEITAYGSDGSKKGNIQTTEYLDACVKDDDTIAVLKSQGICIYSLDGKMTGMEEGIAKTLPDELGKLNAYIESDVLTWYNGFQCVGDYYYLLLENGIYKYKSGVLIERLVSQERACFKENANNIYALLIKEDELFVLAGADKETAYVYTPEPQEKYVVDLTTEQTTEEAVVEPELKELPDGAITVYSLYENNILTAAVDIFKKNHSNIEVTLDIGIPEDSGITVNDAVQALNVKLLSGAGPDVILLDGLNITKYIENGSLLNIADIQTELSAAYPNIFSNILSAYTQSDNTCYALPARFSAPVLVGKKESLGVINNMADLCNYLSTDNTCDVGNSLQIFYPEELFEQLEPAFISTVLDSNGNYQEENLKSMMETLKNIWTQLRNETTDEEQKERDTLLSENPASWNNFTYPISQIIGALLGESNQNTNKLAIGNICKSNEVHEIRVLLNETDGYEVKTISENGQDVFEPQFIMGISASSANHDIAKSFVKELFRADIQLKDPLTNRHIKQGLPIRFAEIERADEIWLNIYNYRYALNFFNPEEKVFFVELFNKLNTPVYVDKTVEEIIEEDIGKYLNGELSIEDYMKSVNERLELYLKE